MNKKRAIRRRKATMIKNVIRLNLKQIFDYWDQVPGDRSYDNDRYRRSMMRRAISSKGKSLRYKCQCERCEENRIIGRRGESERMRQEYVECFQFGYFDADDADIVVPRF